MIPKKMTTLREGFVMADPVPLPATAASIIKEARKHAPGFSEILFDPENSCFKVIAHNKNMDTVTSMVLKFIKDYKRNPENFVQGNVEINFADYDHLRYPDYFAAMPFRAINRDLAEMDHQVNLAKIMVSRGWSHDEGSDQFQRQTGCAISSDLEGTTIYLGAEQEDHLKFAQEMLSIIIRDSVKQIQEERAAELATFKPSVDPTKTVPIKAAAGFYPKPQMGTLIDIDEDDNETLHTATAAWAESVKRSDTLSPGDPCPGFTAQESPEKLDTVSQLAAKTTALTNGRNKKKHKRREWGPKMSPDEQLQVALNDLASGKDVARFHWSSISISYDHVKQAVEANKSAAVAKQPQLLDVCTEKQKAFNWNYDGLENLGQENQPAGSNAVPVPAAALGASLIDLGDGGNNDDIGLSTRAAALSGPAPDNLLD
ncbi:hypothetical protein ACHAQH_000313 [Verticillium albo-atrum]